MREFMYNHQHGIESTLFTLFVAGAIAAVMASVVLLAKVAMENGCNTTGTEYGLEADYRFMADTCFVTLDDGRKVNADNIQAYEEGR